MPETKVLTQLPLGKIKHFIDSKFSQIFYSEKAQAFFSDNFLGKDDLMTDLIHMKDGHPSIVNQWLIDEFDIDMSLEGDYAIAAVLSIVMEFAKRGKFDTFVHEETGIECGAGYHNNVMEHLGFDKDGKEIVAYELLMKGDEMKLFVSEEPIDLAHFDKDLKPKKSFFKEKLVYLTLPLAKYEEGVDLSETFKGSNMVRNSDNQKYDIDSVKTLTRLDLGLDKVEVKQAAAVCMIVASCSPVDLTKRVKITKDFYLYITQNENLLFATKIEQADFIQGDELTVLKEQEEKAIEEANAAYEESMKRFRIQK